MGEAGCVAAAAREKCMARAFSRVQCHPVHAKTITTRKARLTTAGLNCFIQNVYSTAFSFILLSPYAPAGSGYSPTFTVNLLSMIPETAFFTSFFIFSP